MDKIEKQIVNQLVEIALKKDPKYLERLEKQVYCSRWELTTFIHLIELAKIKTEEKIYGQEY